MMMKTPKQIIVTALLGLGICSSAAAQDMVEADLARETLAGLQEISFRKHREYCGFIGWTAEAELVATEATPGTKDSCSAPLPNNIAVVASYHTHGAFDLGYFNETPSTIDMEGDRAFLINGYVSTPGGRLWYIDSRANLAVQICGAGCLPVAPGFFKGANGDIAEQYTYDELRAKIGD